jgi:toxin ParE1/3/4
MPTIKLRPRAKSDISEIWDYIADDSEERADSFVDAIGEKIKTLAKNPMMGRSRDELADNLRSWAVTRRYIVFYFPLSDGVEVVRVLHGSRDIENLFQEEDFF